MLNREVEYLNIIDKFCSKKILVIGDFILDVYLKGTSTRLSPEAPVPVVDIAAKLELTGGAANTAVNLKALGAEVTFLTVVGMDEEGTKATRLIHQAGVNTRKVLCDPDRRTIVKTRVMVGSHVLTRYDYGTETPVGGRVEKLLIRNIRAIFSDYDAVVISDYNKGIVTPKVLEALQELQQNSPQFIAVDSKRLPFFKALQPSLVKPNYDEVVKLANLPYQGSARIEQIQSLGDILHEHTAAGIIAVTLDKEGAMIFEKNKFVYHACTHPVSSPNVVGAGDTFVSAFTLAATSGAALRTSAIVSCAASTIAVRKEATASCSRQELKAYFAMSEKQVYAIEELKELCAVYKSQGKRIVFTNGCFDILHSGHVSYLNRARQLGDILIVGVNTDESIRRLKGSGRPINPLSDRMQVLAGLSSINHIIAFGAAHNDTPIPLIQAVQPDVFVKGGDYTRDKLPEADTVEQAGGEIVFLSLVPDHSTTQIIQQIYKTSTLAVA